MGTLSMDAFAGSDPARKRLLDWQENLLAQAHYPHLMGSPGEFARRFAQGRPAKEVLLGDPDLAYLAAVAERDPAGAVRLVASTMLLRYFDDALVASETAALARHAGSAMAAVMERIAWWARANHVEHIVGFQARGRFTDRVGYSFVERRGNTGHTALVPMHLLGASVYDTALAGDGPEVGPLREGEAGLFDYAVARRLPPLVARALGHRGYSLRQCASTARFGRLGLLRSRAVLVARDEGHPIAFAVADAGPPHLMDLHCQVSLYPVYDGAEAAHGALVDACRGYFGSRGVNDFVVLAAPGDLPSLRASGLTDHGAGIIWVTGAALYADLVDHFAEISRPRRRRAA